MSKLSRNRGRNVEQHIARFWQGHRNHYEAEDIAHPTLSIESKARSKMPIAIRKWYSQARAACPDGKTAIVHLHEMGDDYDKDLVIIAASDLRDIVGEA